MITSINEFKKHNDTIGRSTSKYSDDDINYEPEPFVNALDDKIKQNYYTTSSSMNIT